MICEKCNGSGKTPILYCDRINCHLSNEISMQKAGEVYGHEECSECAGSGEVFDYVFIDIGHGCDLDIADDATDNQTAFKTLKGVRVKEHEGFLKFYNEENYVIGSINLSFETLS